MVFEERVLRKICGPKREEDESWRKLHYDELQSLYSSPNIVRVIKSRRMKWVRHVECTEGRRPLGRLRCRWEDNIKMDFREVGINGVNWIQLAQGRVQWQTFVNMVMNLWIA
jgi:hypothetical protein